MALISLFYLSLLSQDRPVIRLDEAYIEGTIRKPPLIELRGSRLEERLEEAALGNLIRLEEKLLIPRSQKDWSTLLEGSDKNE